MKTYRKYNHLNSEKFFTNDIVIQDTNIKDKMEDIKSGLQILETLKNDNNLINTVGNTNIKFKITQKMNNLYDKHIETNVLDVSFTNLSNNQNFSYSFEQNDPEDPHDDLYELLTNNEIYSSVLNQEFDIPESFQSSIREGDHNYSITIENPYKDPLQFNDFYDFKIYYIQDSSQVDISSHSFQKTNTHFSFNFEIPTNFSNNTINFDWTFSPLQKVYNNFLDQMSRS